MMSGYIIQDLQRESSRQYRASKMTQKSDGGDLWKSVKSVGMEGKARHWHTKNDNNYPLISAYVDQGPY